MATATAAASPGAIDRAPTRGSSDARSQDGASLGWSTAWRCGLDDLHGVALVVRLEGEAAVVEPSDAVEFEGVFGVRLVGEGRRLGVGRASGRRTRLGTAVPQAERHAQRPSGWVGPLK